MTKSNATSPFSFSYPWDGLETYLVDQGLYHLPLFAYGSLMNTKSARITLSQTVVDSARPVIGLGIRRVFNCAMVPAGFERHGQPVSPQHIAALGMMSTGRDEDATNGILYSIPFEELPPLREREFRYQLSRVPTLDWETREEIDTPVFVLELNETPPDVLPHVNYLKICEAGTDAVSNAFTEYFRQSTYLVDGTCLQQWERPQVSDQ